MRVSNSGAEPLSTKLQFNDSECFSALVNLRQRIGKKILAVANSSATGSDDADISSMHSFGFGTTAGVA